MSYRRYMLWALLLPLAACTDRKTVTANKPAKDSGIAATAKAATDTPCHNQPIWGYRFVLSGRFKDKAGRQTITEHYYSCRDGQETNKFYSCASDVWEVVDSSGKKENDSYFLCSDPSMDTLRIGGYIGPLFVRNEGDLDGDGNDELSYVPSIAQQSSMNHYHIISYKYNKWVELYSFDIREWQLPPLPQGGRSYGLFGSDGMYTAGSDSMDGVLLKNLQQFNDLLHKTSNGKIKVHTWTDDAEEMDTVVDLRRQTRKPL